MQRHDLEELSELNSVEHLPSMPEFEEGQRIYVNELHAEHQDGWAIVWSRDSRPGPILVCALTWRSRDSRPGPILVCALTWTYCKSLHPVVVGISVGSSPGIIVAINCLEYVPLHPFAFASYLLPPFQTINSFDFSKYIYF